MGITVEKFLDVVSENEVELVAGNAGRNNITEWFHFVEDSYEVRFVKEKELAFSGGKEVAVTTDAFLQFVRQLIEQQCSGLVVAIGRHVQEIPQEVVQFCDEQNFPLLKISSEVDTSDLIKRFCLQILESEKANLQLLSAMKNAISFPQKMELYTPTFLQYGFRKTESYAAVIIKVEKLYRLTSSEVQWIVKSMEGALLSAGDKSFMLTMEDIFVLVFSNYSEQVIQDIVRKIIALLRTKEYTFFVGVSANLSGLHELSKAYLQAKQTVDLCERMDWKNVLVCYDELGAYQLLLAIADEDAKRSYYDSVLGKLEQYDKDNKSDYLYFLCTFLENNCSINDTADKMFVHRNTIVYKIKKIEELLDRNLSDMETRVELYLASMLRNTL